MPGEEVKDILKLDHAKARDFLLKHESYFNVDLPPYFTFDKLLEKLSRELSGKNIRDYYDSQTKPHNCEHVNHHIINNKDGKLSWRPFQIIHPALYVNLVHLITEQSSWENLKSKFISYQSNSKISCLSLPQCSLNIGKDKSEQVKSWWLNVELQSIELALDYSYIFDTDIADCYGSIYTHSIAWAVEGKSEAKQDQSESLLGNSIDKCIQRMQYNQTNGIPQGSVLMDFIAEIILAYVDHELSSKIESVEDYKILRYRDDYRIFVNNPKDGEKILKCLSEVLADMRMHLNSSKTKFSDDVIKHSIKSDKLAWLSSKQGNRSLLKTLLLYKQFSKEFPNSGSLISSLTKFHKRLDRLSEDDPSIKAMISIVVDIASNNPKTYPVSCALLSKLLGKMNPTSRTQVIRKIQSKFANIANIGYMEIWLQRAILSEPFLEFDEKLCKLVQGDQVELWDSSWIGSPTLKLIIEETSIIDQDALNGLGPEIEAYEFNLFSMDYQADEDEEAEE